MVSTEVTQNSPQSSSDSVRITAEIRRQTLITFLTEELDRQQTVVDFEARELESKRKRGVSSAQAERRAANATAVLQYLGSTLRAVAGNRDFVGQVTR